MGGFLRFKMFARTADDDEVVEAVRKDLPLRPRRRAVQAAVGFALILAGLIWTFTLPQLLIENLSQREAAPLRLAVVYGIAAGAVAAVLILSGVRFIADSRAGGMEDRIARLTIDQHDRLAAGQQAGAEPP